MAWMIGVAVFVSLPFTTYTLLAGLQAIPGDLFEAARIDGAIAVAQLPGASPCRCCARRSSSRWSST